MGVEPAIERGEADREGAGQIRRVGAEPAQHARAAAYAGSWDEGRAMVGHMRAFGGMLNQGQA